MSEARQRVMETNRSLRLIKTELENLLEKGVIDDTAFDSIHALLPAEASLSNPGARSNNPTPAPSSAGLPTPASATPAAPSTSSPAPPPRNNPAPPSYAQSTASPPSLPTRNNPPAPAPAAPQKPVLTHARALYRYAATDARDCSFERDDRLAVHEYMNADWWMGRNLRTGQEGIFPRAYVVAVAADGGEKRAPVPVQGYQQPQPQYHQQQQYPGAGGAGAGGGGYPMAPVPVHGYPAAPPPGQPAVPYGQPQQQQPPPPPGQEGGEEGSKMGEHGKKFGKKLGNAAIFGAGATIGSNIVNSIF